MAGKLKGITLEINGDTTGLDTALKGVNQESNKLQSELRQVERLLKLDPTNTELVAQKQEILGKQVETTTEKLNQLKFAQSQVEEQFRRGNIGADQYRAFQREVIQTEQKLNSLDAQLKESQDGFKKVESSVEETSNSFLNMKTAVIGAIAASWAVVGSFASDYDESHRKLQASTGATGEELENMSSIMDNLYTDGVAPLDEIQLAMTEVKNMTGLTGDELQNMTENALYLAKAYDTDVNESTRAANQLMKQFGIEGEQAYNLIVQGMQNGININDEMLDTISEYSPLFAEAGLTAEDMFNIMQAGADGGAWSIDKVGDAVKEMSIRLKDGSTTETLTDLGLEADKLTKAFARGGEEGREAMFTIMTALSEVEDPLEKNRLGVELMGTMYEDLGSEAIDSMAAMSDSYNMNKASMDELEGTMQTLGQTFTSIWNTIMLGFVQPMLNELLPVITQLADMLKEYMPQIQAAFETVFGAITKVFDAFWQLLTTWIDWFVTTFFGDWQTYWVFISTVFNETMDIIQSIFNIFANIFKGDWDSLWADVKELFSSAWKLISTIFNTMIKGIINVLVAQGKNVIKSVVDIATGMWDAVKELPSKAFQLGIDFIQNIIDGVGSMASALYNFVKEIAYNMIDSILSIFGGGDDDEQYDGSHRTGLRYVPYDGYVARLHKGERVLTAPENARYEKGENGSKKIEVTQHIYSPTESPAEQQRKAIREFKRLALEV